MMFSDRLRFLRKQRRMTQKEVGNAIGVPTSTVQSWEAGKAEPQIRHAIKLAQLFRTSVEAMYGCQEYVRSEEERLYKQENIQLRRALMAVKMELSRQEKIIMGELLVDWRKK